MDRRRLVRYHAVQRRGLLAQLGPADVSEVSRVGLGLRLRCISTLGVLIVLYVAGPEWSLVGVLMGEAFLTQYMLGYALRSVRSLA